jgi:hypothetical protein
MLGRGRLYIWFIAGFATILAGFWPSFYGDPHSNDAWHTVHGVAATLWVLLLVTQSLLIGRGARRLHERLGWCSLGLFAVLLVTITYMIWVEMTGPEPFPPVIRQQLVFIDITFLMLFASVYGLALAFRRTPQLHARLMGSTILIAMGPALGRLYAHNIPQLKGLSGALPLSVLTIVAILIVASFIAYRRRDALRPLPALLAAFVLIQFGMVWSQGETFANLLRAAGSPI